MHRLDQHTLFTLQRALTSGSGPLHSEGIGHQHFAIRSFAGRGVESKDLIASVEPDVWVSVRARRSTGRCEESANVRGKSERPDG